LPCRKPLPFRDFADIAEQIEKGLQALDLATARGWDEVERSLGRYGLMAAQFSANAQRFLIKLRESFGVIEPTCAGRPSPT